MFMRMRLLWFKCLKEQYIVCREEKVMLKNTKRKIIAAFLVLLVVSVACIPNDWLHAEGENSESGGDKVEETVSPADGVTIENYERKYSADGKKYYFKNKQGEVSEEGQPNLQSVEVIIDKEKYDSVKMNNQEIVPDNQETNWVVKLSSEGKYEFVLTPKTPVKEDTGSSETDANLQGGNGSETSAEQAALANGNPETSLAGAALDTTTKVATGDSTDTTTETVADDTSDTTTEPTTGDISDTTTDG